MKDENGVRGWRESGLLLGIGWKERGKKNLKREEANFLRNSIIFSFHLLMPKRLRLTNYPSTSGAITHAILFPFPFYIN